MESMRPVNYVPTEICQALGTQLAVLAQRLGCAWVTSTEWNFCAQSKCFRAINKPVSSPVGLVCRAFFLIWSSYFSFFLRCLVCLDFFKKGSSWITYNFPEKWSNGVLGATLVDCNHLVRILLQIIIILSILDFQVGPRIEYSRWENFEDTEVSKILALPDVAHLVCVSCNIQ